MNPIDYLKNSPGFGGTTQDQQSNPPVKTVEDLGKMVKVKHPEYQDMGDIELGQKVKEKHPDYSDFADMPQEPQVDNFSQSWDKGNYGTAAIRGAGNIGGAVNKVLSLPFDAMNYVGTGIRDTIEKTVGGEDVHAANEQRRNKLVQDTIDLYHENVSPDTRQTIADVGNVVGAGLGIMGVRTSIGKLSKSPMLEKYATNSFKKEFEKPVSTNNAAYSKASGVFEKQKEMGHNITDTALKNNVHPDRLIEDGKYSTTDTADSIRADAMKNSNDLLRPSLQMASETSPRASIDDLRKSGLSHIENDRNLTDSMRETQVQKLESNLKSIEKAHPNGLTLEHLHDKKITHDLNSKHSPINDVATNAEATSNRILSEAIRENLIKNAPKEVPVDEFYKQQQKQFSLAEYMDALHGKKAPTGKLAAIRKMVSKAAGVAAGHAIGGGLGGEVLGYHLGGSLDGILSGMSNPIKEYFINNLKRTNPKAYEKLNKYKSSPLQDHSPDPRRPSEVIKMRSNKDVPVYDPYNATQNKREFFAPGQENLDNVMKMYDEVSSKQGFMQQAQKMRGENKRIGTSNKNAGDNVRTVDIGNNILKVDSEGNIITGATKPKHNSKAKRKIGGFLNPDNFYSEGGQINY
jgi:hypothetical protein